MPGIVLLLYLGLKLAPQNDREKESRFIPVTEMGKGGCSNSDSNRLHIKGAIWLLYFGGNAKLNNIIRPTVQTCAQGLDFGGCVHKSGLSMFSPTNTSTCL